MIKYYFSDLKIELSKKNLSKTLVLVLVMIITSTVESNMLSTFSDNKTEPRLSKKSIIPARFNVLLSDENVPSKFSGPGTGWTLCANEDSYCRFQDIQEVAYGTKRNWNYSIEIDGVNCDSQTLKNTSETDAKTCWIRNPEKPWLAVRSIDEWRNSMTKSNQRVRFKRGHYVVQDLLDASDTLAQPFVTAFQFDGSNNLFDMTGVTIDIPVKLLSTMPRNPIHSHGAYKLRGDHITLLNGTFKNTYPNAQHDVTDFFTHNLDINSDYWPSRQMTEFRIDGNNIKLLGNTITVRGSYPYGYGDMFGKGKGASVYLRKHSGIQVKGNNIVIEDLELSVFAFGHGIYMQGADNTIIRNSVIRGSMRLGADILKEGIGSLPYQFDFRQQKPDWIAGKPIVPDFMYSLTEDGIRAYTRGKKLDGTIVKTGSIFVENTQIINMRVCVATALASKPSVIKNVETRGCSLGFSLANNSVIENSRGDAAYGPLYKSHYDTRRNTKVELTVINAPSIGSHPLARIAGSDHRFIFLSDGTTPDRKREIIVGDAGLRWAGHPNHHDAINITVNNKTTHPVILTNTSTNITVSSVGKVKDMGIQNLVTQ